MRRSSPYIKKPHSDAYYAAQDYYAGKGSTYRSVDKTKYDRNFEKIFGKKKYWWEKRSEATRKEPKSER